MRATRGARAIEAGRSGREAVATARAAGAAREAAAEVAAGAAREATAEVAARTAREAAAVAAAVGAAAAIAAAALMAGCYQSHAVVDESRPGPWDDWSACTDDAATASVLDWVESVGDPEGGYIRVRLADGMTYLFDTDEPSSTALADIVESRMGRGEPVYFEYERATKVIVDLGLPMQLEVLTIEAVEEGSAMTFEVSAAIHLMRSTLSCYGMFLGVLEEALADGTSVWVTHNALYEIIDVRPAA